MGRWLFGAKQEEQTSKIDLEKVPTHIAIIMDGNGRWAKRHGLPRVAGHRAGMKKVKEITIAAHDIGVKAITMYAFSTENWKRPKEEIDFLMRLPQEFFPKEINDLVEKNVQIRMIGNKEHLPPYALQPVMEAIERTKHNTGLILNFALNYGSRNELLQGIKAYAEDVMQGNANPSELNEEVFSHYLQTDGLPDPDLLIRTSGELRISNFMLWQLAYTEFFFSDAYWPDFSKSLFYDAIAEYQTRKRRFGGL